MERKTERSYSSEEEKSTTAQTPFGNLIRFSTIRPCFSFGQRVQPPQRVSDDPTLAEMLKHAGLEKYKVAINCGSDANALFRAVGLAQTVAKIYKGDFVEFAHLKKKAEECDDYIDALKECKRFFAKSQWESEDECMHSFRQWINNSEILDVAMALLVRVGCTSKVEDTTLQEVLEDFGERLDTKQDLKKISFHGVGSVTLVRGKKLIESLDNKKTTLKIILAEKENEIFLLKKSAQQIETNEQEELLEEYSKGIFSSIM